MVKGSSKQLGRLLADADRLYVRGRNLKKALKVIEKALHLSPTNTEALVIRGRILFHLDRTQEALICYDKAILLDSKCAEAFLERTRFFYALKRDYKRALQEVRKALKHSKKDRWVRGEALRLQGNILSELNRNREALESHQAAVAVMQRNVDARCDLADSLSAVGQFKKAIAQFNTALRLVVTRRIPDPKDLTDVIYRKTLVLNEMGKYAESLKLLERGSKQVKTRNARKDLRLLLEETRRLQKQKVSRV